MSKDVSQNCSLCRFWAPLRPNEGVCQRYAPSPDVNRAIAHWRQSHGTQWCGHFDAGTPDNAPTTCFDCRFWRARAAGAMPVDRLDKPAAWWENAGHCYRHAGQPSSEPGPRAFWPATNGLNSCGDGEKRAV